MEEDTGAHCASESTMTRDDHIRMAALDMALRSIYAETPDDRMIVNRAETFSTFLRGA